MEYIFKAMLITSCAGGMLAILVRLVQPVTKRFFSALWHYVIWISVLCVMLVPIKLNLPQKLDFTQEYQPVEISEQIPAVQNPINDEAEKPVPKDGGNMIKLRSHNSIIPGIWFYTALGLALLRLSAYIAFLLKIRSTTEVMECPEIAEYTKRRITVRRTPELISPCMIGILHPTLLLGGQSMTQEQLDNVFRHEFTHLRRGDVLIKWLTALAKCIHWFNPAVYYVAAKLSAECEISCDLSVVRNMDRSSEMSYVNTILSLLAAADSKTSPLTTGMTGSKKILKRRFKMIKNKKKIGIAAQIASVVLGLTAVVAAASAGGILAGGILADSYIIDVENGGKNLEFSNKPFVDNEVLYLPLRETFEHCGADGSIEYDGGLITITGVDERINPLTGETRRMSVAFDTGARWLEFSYDNASGSPIERRIQGDVLQKNRVTYVPYDFFRYFSDFGKLTAEVSYADGNDAYVRDETYYNEDMNFTLEMPLSWRGKYIASEHDGIVNFMERTAYEKYGMGAGELFSILKVDRRVTQEELDNDPPQEPVTRRIIMYNDGTYLLLIPGDVQFSGSDAETLALHEQLSKNVDKIADSIQPIVRIAE